MMKTTIAHTCYTGLVALILLVSISACTTAQKGAEESTKLYRNESQEDFDKRMAWWREARFGMFIHWGAYAVPAGTYKGEKINGIGEWIMARAKIPVSEYEELVRQFNPEQFDADAWVRIAKDAGMKYIVITSKHHDGFCLWDSKVTDYDVMDFSPIKRDLLAELKAACEKEGIKLCFYHSIMDWHHPDAQAPYYPSYNDREKTNPNFQRYVDTYLKPQLKELVTGYNPHIIWFDGEWGADWTHEHGLDMYEFIRGMDPDILVNNRVDKGRQGMQGMNKEDGEYVGDFGTPEQEILEGTSTLDWESCMTMNDTWGFKSYDENWKTAENLIHNLVDIAAKGGNYLLNVGPTAEGLIPGASVERLAEMGDWMDVNHEAIYGSRLWKTYKDGEQIRYTQTGDDQTVYAVSLGWPGQKLTLTQLQPKAGSEVKMLGFDAPISWETGPNNETILHMPDILQDPGNRPCKYAYAFRVEI